MKKKSIKMLGWRKTATSQTLKRMAPPITKLLMTTRQLVTETVWGSSMLGSSSAAGSSTGMTDTVKLGSVFPCFLRWWLSLVNCWFIGDVVVAVAANSGVHWPLLRLFGHLSKIEIFFVFKIVFFFKVIWRHYPSKQPMNNVQSTGPRAHKH